MKTFHSAIRQRRTNAGFTFTELVIVFAIIAVLISMLIPAINMMRASAKNVQCVMHLRKIYFEAKNWSDEHQGYLMPASWSLAEDEGHTFSSLVTQGMPYKYLNCPTSQGSQVADKNSASYGINFGVCSPGPGPGTGGTCVPPWNWGYLDKYYWETGNTKAVTVRTPAEKIYFMDANVYVATYLWPGSIKQPHRGKANIAWIDGHCSVQPSDFNSAYPNGIYFDKP